MAAINGKVVRRSNALASLVYERTFLMTSRCLLRIADRAYYFGKHVTWNDCLGN